MANAGQTGGAPAGATLSTARNVITGADTTAPATTIACNGAACAGSLHGFGLGDAGRHRHRLWGREHPLHHRRVRPHAVQPHLHRRVPGGGSTATVKYASWDYAGNAETAHTQTITVQQQSADTTPPTTTISCNGAACASTAYTGPVTVTLSRPTTRAARGSRVPTTRPTGPRRPRQHRVHRRRSRSSRTTTVQFFSTDLAGNAEQVQSQQIKVAPVTTKVSLTFDNGTISQYTLGYQQALQPHGAHATFFVNSGNVSVSSNIMTWAQLGTLAGAGNDIGGKTVNATNLTTDPNPTAQVCNDRAALLQHSLTPVAFAYPGGAYNATLEGIVNSCGYGNARTAGSLSPAGPTYAETLPPKDWLATRAYAATGQVTLANMEALVSGAAAHGGGWSQIVIGKVCSQAQDPANYNTCTTSAGWIELADLNSFLAWMGNAGQSGSTAGAALSTVGAAASSADILAPVATIACNGSTCSSGVYSGTVYVTLPSTDVGSGVASTRYTTDGSDPSPSSPAYTGQIPVTATTTIKFRSWDNAGNAEAVKTQLIQASLPPDTTPPATTIACDGAACTTAGYNGSTTVTLTATRPRRVGC